MSDEPATDVQVLSAARAGDHDAGAELMKRFGASLLRTAWSVLGNYGGTEAQDVVQEAYIAALTTPALPEGDVGAWMRSIAARKAVDFLRRARRHPARPLPDPAEGEREPEASGNPAAVVEVLIAREALGRLTAVDRAVLTMVDLEGRSMEETAAALHLTRIAVKLRAMRARRKLAAMLRTATARGAKR